MPRHDEEGHGKLRTAFLKNRSDSAGQPRPDLWRQGLLDYNELDVDASILWKSIGPAPLYIDSQVKWTNPDGSTTPDSVYQGEGPDSGEVTDIAIDPSGTADTNLYIATNDGGIWKTTDGGSNWIPPRTMAGSGKPLMAARTGFLPWIRCLRFRWALWRERV